MQTFLTERKMSL